MAAQGEVPIAGDERIEEGQPKHAKSDHLDHFLVETGLKKKEDMHCAATSRSYFIKHVGYNNIEILKGREEGGEPQWLIDVRAKLAGWSITVRRPDQSPILQLKKDVTFARLLGWDKGTSVDITDPQASAGEDLQASSNNKNPTPGTTDLTAKCKKFLSMFNKTKKSLATREKITGEPNADDVIVPDMSDSEYGKLNEKEVTELPARAVTTITRQHAFRSNENVFTYQGKQYAWNYWVFLGSTLYLREVASGEELAVVQLLPTWRWQIISSWSWRLNGTLEIKEEAVRRGMEDIVVATLTAMLEWRKHNNKVWIVAATIA